MRKRAEDVEATRRQIIEATARLHTTIGPARTTISAIAEEAGVTRLTVYRHFPDEEALFGACSAHWLALRPPPDPSAWRALEALDERLERAIADMYCWYELVGGEYYTVAKDRESIPEGVRRATEHADEARVDAVVGAARLGKTQRRAMRAAIGHALDFWTWHSLVVRRGLNNHEAIDVARRFVGACLTAPRKRSRRQI